MCRNVRERETGCIIIPYGSGEEARQAIEDGLNYNLAIIDRSLGQNNHSGDEIIRLSKRKNPKTLVWSLSCYFSKAPEADGHLLKPISMERVGNRIREALLVQYNKP